MTNNIFFVTSTINNWTPLLSEPAYRDLVIQSLQILINDRRIELHGYVIMPTHIHLIYSVLEPYSLSDISRDFHKFTAQQIIKSMRNNGYKELAPFKSKRTDRQYQIWQSTHSPKQIESYSFFKQKLEYIHNNPCSERWRLCERPEDYPFSSARDYLTGQPGILRIDKVLQ